MRIDVITLFPEWLKQLTDIGVTGRGITTGHAELHCWNPRDYTSDRHNTTDDRPYGGGPGMVMLAEPLRHTLTAVMAESDAEKPLVTALSPQGRALDQQLVNELSERQNLVLICGRYEGIDQRFVDEYVDEQISLGDYVLSGGELAAAVIIDAVIRLLPGVLGHHESAIQDSFMIPETTGSEAYSLLDYPHYTRPETWHGQQVPDVLLSGNHAEIARWRRQQALLATWKQRPDLLTTAKLSPADQQLLSAALQMD